MEGRVAGCNAAHLVEDLILGIGDLDSLLMRPSLLVQLDALCPVIEGSGDDDLVGGGVRPVGVESRSVSGSFLELEVKVAAVVGTNPARRQEQRTT